MVLLFVHERCASKSIPDFLDVSFKTKLLRIFFKFFGVLLLFCKTQIIKDLSHLFYATLNGIITLHYFVSCLYPGIKKTINFFPPTSFLFVIYISVAPALEVYLH